MTIDPHEKPTWGLMVWGSVLPTILGVWLIFLPNFSIIAAVIILFLYIAFWVYFVGLYRQERYALARLGFIGISSLLFLGFPLRLSPANATGIATASVVLITYVGVLAAANLSIPSDDDFQIGNSEVSQHKLGRVMLIGGLGTAIILLVQSLTGSFEPVKIFLAVAGYLCACGFGWLTIQHWVERRSQ